MYACFTSIAIHTVLEICELDGQKLGLTSKTEIRLFHRLAWLESDREHEFHLLEFHFETDVKELVYEKNKFYH